MPPAVGEVTAKDDAGGRVRVDRAKADRVENGGAADRDKVAHVKGGRAAVGRVREEEDPARGVAGRARVDEDRVRADRAAAAHRRVSRREISRQVRLKAGHYAGGSA